MKNTVRLKADNDEKSALAGSEFHTVKIVWTLCRIWAKSNNPRDHGSYWRFSTFSPYNFRGRGTVIELFSGVRGTVPTSPNLAKTYGDRFYRRNLFQSSDILLHFRTREVEW